MQRPQIAIDAQLMFGTPTGIGEYLHGLLPALRSQGVVFDMLAKPEYDPWRFDRRVIWDQVLLPKRARRYRLLHCTSGTMPLHALSATTIVTVHDVAWLRVQQHARWYARKYFGSIMLNAYRRAHSIITVSSFSRDELLSFGGFAPDNIHVVYPGVSTDFINISRRMERPREETPFILAVGTVERRKNLALAILALSHMKDTHVKLISCGPPTPYLEECKALAGQLGLLNRIEFRGYVTRAELLQLYAKATAAVVPSLYEGFGLGAAQALVAGLPVLVADTSSLPEIAGTDAHVLDVLNVDAWARALDDLVANPSAANEKAQQLRMHARERFSWTTAAQKTAALYAELI